MSSSWSVCCISVTMYTNCVPKLWDDTIEAHRQAVRGATLDTTTALIAERGLRSVTMSQIAEATGIGRATLYKYFPDVEAVLLAWHEREVARHLRQLQVARNAGGTPIARLEAVLQEYAVIMYDTQGRHDADLAGLLHRDEHVARGQHLLRELLRALLADAAAVGDVRDDVAPEELAIFCLHAMSAARGLSSRAAVHRLIEITLSGLRPQT